jgi:hypothetical protein
MAYSSTIRAQYQQDLLNLKEVGLFKEERYIHSPQSADIEVEFPSGASTKKVINLCANNYLGLSSNPDVVAAAHAGLDARGYGMSSVRFICGTQDIHRELEQKLTEFLGTEDTLLFPSCMDANAGVFEAMLAEQDVMIAEPPRSCFNRGRNASLQGHAGHLQALRHGTPRRKTSRASGQAHSSDYHRWCLLHGRRSGQAR